MLAFKNIEFQSKEDFIDYFIYYYEYTFLLEEFEDMDIKKELLKIVNSSPYKEDLDDNLWKYTYIKFHIKILKDYPLDYFVETLNKLSKNFIRLNQETYDVILELIQEVFSDIGLSMLEIRPYEQLKLNPPYGIYLNKKEKSIIKFFQENIDKFSETKVNQCRFVKIKNSKYIDFSTNLFELYSIILFEIIENLESIDNLKEIVDDKILDFIKTFKKGKLDKVLVENLSKKTYKYACEYYQQKKLQEKINENDNNF